MAKRTLTVLLTLALIVPALQASEKLTWRDCTKVFTWANAVEKSSIIDGRQCGEAWHLSYARDGEDEFLGYVFLSKLSVANQEVNLIIGLTAKGEIARVVVQEHGVADAEFLAQFEGRNVISDFAFAETAAALTTTPTMLKAMRGKEELSMAIAGEINAVLAAATGESGIIPTP